jgi:hypothetical protein
MHTITYKMNNSYGKVLINLFSESQTLQCLTNRVVTTNTIHYLKKEIRKLNTCSGLVNRMNMGQKYSMADAPFKNVAKIIYWVTTQTNHNCQHKELNS